MGDRVVNENPVAPFDHRNPSSARATKPFRHAQNGRYKDTNTATTVLQSSTLDLYNQHSEVMSEFHPAVWEGAPSSLVPWCQILNADIQ